MIGVLHGADLDARKFLRCCDGRGGEGIAEAGFQVADDMDTEFFLGRLFNQFSNRSIHGCMCLFLCLPEIGLVENAHFRDPVGQYGVGCGRNVQIPLGTKLDRATFITKGSAGDHDDFDLSISIPFDVFRDVSGTCIDRGCFAIHDAHPEHQGLVGIRFCAFGTAGENG